MNRYESDLCEWYLLPAGQDVCIIATEYGRTGGAGSGQCHETDFPMNRQSEEEIAEILNFHGTFFFLCASDRM